MNVKDKRTIITVGIFFGLGLIYHMVYLDFQAKVHKQISSRKNMKKPTAYLLTNER